jgi:Spy/CpxP family protein refolding chaperone
VGAVESRLFSPETVMQRQGELGLDERQRATLVAEVDHAESEMRRLRWDLEREREALVKLLDAEPVDERAVGATAKRMTDVEARIKAVNLTMLVRVKNTLTPAQKAKLRADGAR